MGLLLQSLQAHTGILLQATTVRHFTDNLSQTSMLEEPFRVEKDLLEVRAMSKGLHHLDSLRGFLAAIRGRIDREVKLELPPEDLEVPERVALRQEQAFQAFLSGSALPFSFLFFFF